MSDQHPSDCVLCWQDFVTDTHTDHAYAEPYRIPSGEPWLDPNDEPPIDRHCGFDSDPCRVSDQCVDRLSDHASLRDGDYGPTCDTCGLPADNAAVVADALAYEASEAAHQARLAQARIDAAYLAAKGEDA